MRRPATHRAMPPTAPPIFYSADEKSLPAVGGESPRARDQFLDGRRRTADLRGLVRECTRHQEELGGLATDDEDKVDEAYAPGRSLTQDDTAETNTTRETIMITSGRRVAVYRQSVLRHEFVCVWMDGRRSGTVCTHFTFVLRFDRASRGSAAAAARSRGDSPVRVQHVASYRCLRLATDAAPRHRSDARPRPSHSLTMRSSRRRRRRRRRTQTNDAASNQSLCDAILASSVPASRLSVRLLLLTPPLHCYVFGDILLETAT